MSEDITKKIDAIIAENFGDTGAIEPEDIHELVAELESYKQAHEDATEMTAIWMKRTKKAETEVKRLKAILANVGKDF